MFRALEVLSEVKTRLSHLGRSSIHIVRTRNRYGGGYSQNPSECFFNWSSRHFPLGHHGKPMLHGHQIWGWKITPTPKKCEILGQKMKDIIFSTTTMIYKYIGMPDMILVQIHDFFHKKIDPTLIPLCFLVTHFSGSCWIALVGTWGEMPQTCRKKTFRRIFTTATAISISSAYYMYTRPPRVGSPSF